MDRPVDPSHRRRKEGQPGTRQDDGPPDTSISVSNFVDRPVGALRPHELE
jgi:hypothetical protein